MRRFSEKKALVDHIVSRMSSEQLDFLVYSVVSHWHAIGVDALVGRIAEEKHGPPSGIVVIWTAAVDDRTVTDKDFICDEFANVEFCLMDGGPEGRAVVQGGSKAVVRNALDFVAASIRIANRSGGKRYPIVVASVMLPSAGSLLLFSRDRLGNKYRPRFVVIDEGIGMYMSSNVWRAAGRLVAERLDEREAPERRRTSDRVGHSISRFGARLATAFVRCLVSPEEFYLFHRSREGISPNGSVVAFYKRAIMRRAGTERVAVAGRPVAALVSQPFSELGQVPLSLELDTVRVLIDACLESGFDVLVKPHPAETAGKFGAVVQDHVVGRVRVHAQDRPIEEWFAVERPACTIGYTSTALITGKIIFDIPAITVTDMVWRGISSELLKVQADAFVQVFGAMVSNVKTLDELKSALISLRGRNARQADDLGVGADEAEAR